MGILNVRIVGAILISSLVLDAIWLLFRYDYHVSLIKSIQGMAPKVRPVPALMVYVVIALSLAYFVVEPASNQKIAIRNGAILGAAMYGLYDFTNYATFTRWPASMVLIDILWGAVLSGLAAGAGFYVKNK